MTDSYRWLQIAIVWFGCTSAAIFFSVVSGAIVYSWIAIVAMLWERS